jgi:Skp family chaperone for outer membrane proteins
MWDVLCCVSMVLAVLGFVAAARLAEAQETASRLKRDVAQLKAHINDNYQNIGLMRGEMREMAEELEASKQRNQALREQHALKWKLYHQRKNRQQS